MKDYFYELASFVEQQLGSQEASLLNYSGESSDFVRLNQARYRQAGSVEQHVLGIRLIASNRSVESEMVLSKDRIYDQQQLKDQLTKMRERVEVVPEDPYLLYSQEPHSSEQLERASLPDSGEVCESIIAAASHLDLVGIYAAGSLYRGFANSLGQRNFFTAHPYNLDMSVYHHQDKAIKLQMAGKEWSEAAFHHQIKAVQQRLPLFERTPKTIEPGKYPVYLAPAALDEIIGLLYWGGFSERAMQTKQSPLLWMREGKEHFHPKVFCAENTQEGLSPAFQSAGFMKPSQVTLISEGNLHQTLISPRTAKEYQLEHNGAYEMESPSSFEMQGGDLPVSEVLKALGTGIYIGNLWYLNYSDRNAGRITGMTRFGTFWVEKGALVAPLNVMRFDESVFRMLGSHLIDLSQEREILMDNGTYGERSTKSSHLPGALVRDFNFTL